MFEEYLNLAVKAIFVENMALTFFLGMCSFLAVSKKVETAVGLGFAVIFVLTVTVPANNLIQTHLLNEGALTWISPEFAGVDLTFLNLLCFIGTLAAMVQLVAMTTDRFFPAPHATLGTLLPPTPVNCALPGASLSLVDRRSDSPDSVTLRPRPAPGPFIETYALPSTP